MKLYVAATGSQANAYVLSSDTGESLILDAGVPVRKALPGIPDLRKISGCLITHEHLDHARAWTGYAHRGIPVYASAGTQKAMTDPEAAQIKDVKPMQAVHIGRFCVMPFETQHDAEEPLGFLIRYEPTGETVLYATDTYYLKYTFPGINYWIVECNYCEDMIDASEMNDYHIRRLNQSHMNLRRLKNALQANDLTETAKIILIHLSDSRSDEKRMVGEIESLTGIETVAALGGMDIELSRTPF